MKWEHNGAVIEFDATRGKFVTTVSGKRVVSPSLDAAKARLDKAKSSDFEAFDAVVNTYGSNLRTVRIVGIRRARSKYGSEFEFVSDAGDAYPVLIPATPENAAKVEEFLVLKAANSAKANELQKATDAARTALPHLRADDYKPAEKGKSDE